MMSWRDLMQPQGKDVSNRLYLRNISTKSTKPLEQIPEVAEINSFVDFVDRPQGSQGQQCPNPLPFQVGQLVTYKVPIIKTAVDYIWEWHLGTVQESWQELEMVIITPCDEQEKLFGIPFVYVQVYEKTEINEIMEIKEHGQESD